VGGLFRHVIDLARGQSARGHRVGVVADSSTGGPEAAARLEALRVELALGVTRIPMSRDIGVEDLPAVAHVGRRAAEAAAHVIHGHGAKGGAYARLARNGPALRVYTPHGGSIHYGWASVKGCLYLSAERALRGRTDLFLFESNYGRDVFAAKIGRQDAPAEVVHNGVCEAEFAPIRLADDASDIVFVGELRRLKGLDVLIRARRLPATGPTGKRSKPKLARSGSSEESGLLASPQRGPHSHWAASSSCRHVPNRSPMLRWRPPQRVGPSSQPMSAAFRRSSAPMLIVSFLPATTRRLLAPLMPR
jgi:glycosyltransferase involved in cell wall biosynthesis